MKTRLNKRLLRAAAAALLLSVACGVFLWGRAARREAAFWQSLAVTAEPEQCALCENSNAIRCHAPALLALSTGCLMDMEIYQHGQARPHELAEVQPEDTGVFQHGCSGSSKFTTRTREAQQCRASLPDNREPLDLARFCRDCRALLAQAAREGFLLLDLDDLSHIRAYPVEEGAAYTIRDYAVSISRSPDTEGLTLLVTGNLMT